MSVLPMRKRTRSALTAVTGVVAVAAGVILPAPATVAAARPGLAEPEAVVPAAAGPDDRADRADGADGADGDGPAIVVEPDEIAERQRPGETASYQLDIGNRGDAPLSWEAVPEPETQPRPPVHPTTPVRPVAQERTGTLGDFPGHRGRRGWTVTPEPADVPAEQLVLTHSGSQSLVAGASLACRDGRGAGTAESGYLRHFTPADFGVVGDFSVSAVTVGVESARGAATALTVNLYALDDPDAAFRYDELSRLGTAETTVAGRTMSLVEVPVSGTVPAGATLVVEVEVPAVPGAGVYLGAHPGDQTAPSYLRADACGLPEPAPTGQVGAPGLQLLLNVTGSGDLVGCALPADLPWLELAPTTGTVAPGETQPATLTLDTTGLADGDSPATTLCLASDDPERPRVEVPVALTVVGPACDETIRGVHPDPVTVTDGVTCLVSGAQVQAEVNVLDGAGLIVEEATVQGPVATFGATVVEVTGATVVGPVAIRGTTGRVTVTGSEVVGSMLVVGGRTAEGAPVIAGNTLVGSLYCADNQPPPEDGGHPNAVLGGSKLDQCADL